MRIFIFSCLLIILIQIMYSFDFDYLSTEKTEDNQIHKLFSWSITKYKNNENYTFCYDCIPEKIKSLNENVFFCNFPRKNKNSTFTFALYNKDNDYFEPWPNLTLNQFSSNYSELNLISVTAFEIDEDNNIYILDNGRINYNKAENNTSIKLFIYSQDGKLLNYTNFSEINSINDSIDYSNIYFTDMVFDKKHKYMILSDSNILSENGKLKSKNPGIYILTLDSDKHKLYKILNDSEYFKPDKSYWYHFNDTPIYPDTPIQIGITGLALSCNMEYIFFTSLSSLKFYSISTHEIHEYIEKNTEIHVYSSYKKEASYGLVFSNKGNLYMSGVESGSIYLANQIDNDLGRFDYRDLYQIKINKTNMLAKYMDVNNGNLYFIVSKINDSFWNITEEKNETFSNFEIDYYEVKGEKSYRYGCFGVENSVKIGSMVIWAIFLFVLFMVFVFVCASRPTNEIKYAALNFNQ